MHLQPSSQTTKSFVVDSDGVADDVSPGDCRCATKLVENSAANTKVCTLRAAIQEGHSFTGVGKITSDSRIIRLVKSLPVIQTPQEINLNVTTIDGIGVKTLAPGLHIESEEAIV